MIARQVKALQLARWKRGFCCVVIILLFGIRSSSTWATDTVTAARPSVVTTVADHELTVRAVGTDKIELTTEGRRLLVAKLPKDTKRITEVRACKWRQGGLPPGLAAAIEAELADGQRSYFWATFCPSSQKEYELLAIDEFLTAPEDFDLVGIVNSTGDSIYVTLLRHNRDAGPDEFIGHLFVHNCPRAAAIKGQLLRLEAVP
jgi:hypothetical protein